MAVLNINTVRISGFELALFMTVVHHQVRNQWCMQLRRFSTTNIIRHDDIKTSTSQK
jgi:hypothetical protein